MTWKQSFRQGAENLAGVIVVIAILAAVSEGVQWLWAHGLADALSATGWGLLYGAGAVYFTSEALAPVLLPILFFLSILALARVLSDYR